MRADLREPEPEIRTLASAMDTVRYRVFEVIVAFSHALGAAPPKNLDLGLEHDQVLPEAGGNVLWLTDDDGPRRAVPLTARPQE